MAYRRVITDKNYVRWNKIYGAYTLEDLREDGLPPYEVPEDDLTNAITTEDGEPITTEDGFFFVTEDA
jgi:hypothetical protein